MRLKVSSAKRRPFCLGLNELIDIIGIINAVSWQVVYNMKALAPEAGIYGMDKYKYIPQLSVGCDQFFIPWIPAPGNNIVVLMWIIARFSTHQVNNIYRDLYQNPLRQWCWMEYPTNER